MFDLAKQGRPRLEKPKKNRLMIRLDDGELSELKEYASKQDLTITEAVRKGIRQMLDSEK